MGEKREALAVMCGLAMVVGLLARCGLAASPATAGVYINSDAWNFWLDPELGKMSRDELRHAIEADVDFYAVKGVRAVFYNMNFQRCFFPTKVGTPYWKDISFDAAGRMLLRGRPITYDAGERAAKDPDWCYRTMYEGVTNMVRSFPEYMAYRYGYCHRKGIEMWHSFRVNDIHHATLGLEWRPQHGDLWLDHKECVRAWYRHTWRGEWPDGTLDYGDDKVYAYHLGLVREYLMDYPSDGLEFDWLRAVPVFKPGFDDFHRDRLTQFLRETRRIADEAERKWGHRIRLAHRVPARVRDAHGLGMDIARWAKEGLVDVLMPGGCPGTATEQDCEVALYRALAPKPVVIAAEIDCSVFAQPGWYESIDNKVFGSALDAGFASNFYQQGADAIYFYNHFPRHGRAHPWVKEFFTQASDRTVVARLARRHPATYHVRCGESRRDEPPFPAEIWSQCCNGGVNIGCGEGTAGRPAQVVIGATVPLDVDVLVNTVPCGRAEPLGDASGYPTGRAKTTYYTVDIPVGALHDGINNVELFNHGKDTIKGTELVWMEIAISAAASAGADGALAVRQARSGKPVSTAALTRELVTTSGPTGACGHVLRLVKRQKGDLALEVEYAAEIPEATGALVWHHDMRTSRTVSAADGRVRNASRQVTVGTEWLSYWPFAVATGADGKGRALALDPDYPAFYRLELDAEARRLVLHLDIALTDESPTAEVRFAEYAVAGVSPFRSALTGYYARYPKAFASRVREHGVWMPFSKISEVRGWEDFGFKFKEGGNEPDWDKAHGIHTFLYTEPTTWWHDIAGPTNAYGLVQAAEKVKAHGDPLAKAWKDSVFLDRDGNPVGFIKDTPWCKGVVWNYNDAPGIDGETTGWKVKMSHAPRCEYVDSAEMYVTVPLDFNRAHFRGMKTPLCWDARTGRPAVFKGLIGYEYVRAAAEKAHGAGFLTMANGTPVEWFWLAPNLDVLGTEWDWQDWRNGRRVWTPPSDTELIYRRALCGKKPFCFLMNTDFALLTPERAQRYFDRCLAYGAFPGFFSIDAATAPYFTRPELYERDRPLYRRYLPVVKMLSEAGWEPDNRLLETSDKRVVSEQFGDRYVTLFNPLDHELELKVRFAGKAVREMLADVPVAHPRSWTVVKLAAESARAYDVRP